MTEYVTVKASLPNKNFKDIESKIINIKILGLNKNNDVEYEYSIPDFLYEELKDTEPKYRSTPETDPIGIRTFSEKKHFKKKIKSTLISDILSQIEAISYDAISKNGKEELKKDKKIFVKFLAKESHDRCEWTHGYKGKVISSRFQFFVGYEIEERDVRSYLSVSTTPKTIKKYYTLIKYATGTGAHKDTGFQEGSKLEPLHYDQDSTKFAEEYSILDWSQEAEDYLRTIQEKFVQLNANLTDYLSDLTDEKLKFLIENSNSKLLL